MTDYQVKRAYNGAVLVAPPGADPVSGEWRTSKDQKRYFYTNRPDVEKYGRASKAGEHLKGGGDGLANWKAAMAAIGVLTHPGVRSQIATLMNEYDGDPYYGGDDGGTKSGKARLLEAVELACEMAGSSTAASRGTEFHKLGELVNKGKQPTLVQPHLRDYLAHYQARVAPITFLAQEILIVNDDLRRAGSVDYLFQLPAGLTTPDGQTHQDPLVCVGDLKTGRWDAEYPAGVSAQLAAYGLGHRYDQETNERSDLHPNINKGWGVLVHYPIGTAGAEVGFYWVDLGIGSQAATLSNRIDAMTKYYRSEKGKPVRFDLG